jgi:hypothetical protein
VIQS